MPTYNNICNSSSLVPVKIGQLKYIIPPLSFNDHFPITVTQERRTKESPLTSVRNLFTGSVANWSGSFRGNFIGGSSNMLFAGTSSYTISSSRAISSSYAISASCAVSASYAFSSSNSVSSSYALTSSFSVSSSYSISSSYALSASHSPSDTPIGEIIAFGNSTTIPTELLICDGTNISRTTYSNLFNVIGTTFGIGNGSTTFTIPDLRGVFIRGFNGVAGIYDVGRVYGSYQADALLTHASGVSIDDGPDTVANAAFPSIYANSPATSKTYTSTATGSTENRPKNLALTYCIRY